MSINIKAFCRKSSLSAALLLFFHVCFSQNNFSKVDDWLKNNVAEEGGRVVLLVYKDGKIVYSKSENELSNRQKMIGKFIAKRQGKDASEMMQDFTTTSR